MVPLRPVPEHRTDAGSARRQAAALALVLAGAFALRAWAAAGNDFPTVDGTQYLDQAWQLLHRGRLPFSCFPPGWPMLAAIPLRFFPADDPMAMLKAAHLANVVLGTVFCWLSYTTLKRHLGFGLALAATIFLALLPQNVVLAKSDLSEVSYGCGLLAGWLLLERRRDLAGGLVLGYTYLIRPEALLATIGFAAWRWLADRRLPWRLMIGQLVPMIPYLVFIRVATGAWDLSSKSVALTQSLDAHPGAGYLGLIASNLGQLMPLLPGQIGWPLALLAVYGLVRGRKAWMWLLAPLLPVPFVINPMVLRFWLPYLPLILLGAVLGGRTLLAQIESRRQFKMRRLPAALLVAVCVIGLGAAAVDDVPMISQNTEAYHGLKDAGLWLRGQVEPDDLVAAYKPYAPYWAGCRFLKYPDLSSGLEYALWARNNDVDYLVVNVQIVGYYLPGLDDLLVSPLGPLLADKLELVHTEFYERTGDNTVVYRVIHGVP